jgi:hypothetical protein
MNSGDDSSGDVDNDAMDDAHTGSEPASAIVFPYASGHPRAKVVLALLVIGLLLCIAMFTYSFQEYRLHDLSRKVTVTNEQIESNLRAHNVLRLVWLPWYVITGIAFLMWKHRAHRNLPALGATDLEFSPRGAVGWYFCPFLNLFKPYQAMREICNASNPSYLSIDGSAWRSRNAPAVVRIWWAFFLIMNFVTRAVASAENSVDTPAAFRFVAAASMVDYGITMIAATSAIGVVWLIDRRQFVQADKLGLI